MTTQVYVDESKSRDYVIAAAVVVPGDVTSLRKSLRKPLPRGQRRLHMVNEKPPLRRKILSALADERVSVDLYVAGEPYATNIDRRRACLERLVEDIASHCIALTLESDRTQDRRDQRDLIEITRRVGCRDLRTTTARRMTSRCCGSRMPSAGHTPVAVSGVSARSR